MGDKRLRQFDNIVAVFCAVLLLLILVLASGCNRSADLAKLRMTPQEMRAAIDECTKHGLRSVLVHDMMGPDRIECRPPE